MWGEEMSGKERGLEKMYGLEITIARHGEQGWVTGMGDGRGR
jgi:hypothetical protein